MKELDNMQRTIDAITQIKVRIREECKVTRSTLSNWMLGKTKPPFIEML